jgi:protocatechuate 3,4-dioxygenase beta subunit
VAVLAAAAAVVIYFVTRRHAPPSPPAKPAAVVAPVAAAPAPASSARMPEAAHDDDPVGTFRLEGQVIDEHEQPVAGAEVGIDANPVKVVKSDASGSFVFDGLIARAYAVEARADAGYAGPVRVRLGAKPEPVTLRLHAGGSVEVAVTDGTAPIANASVELRATVLWTATTNAAGVATFSHVGAEWAPLVASAPGFAPAAMMLGTSGDPKAPVRVALVLARGAAVSGVVVDGAGKPVGGARVVATAASEPFPVVDSRRDGVIAKPDGTFELRAIGAGTWRLTATHATFGPTTSTPIALDGAHAKTGVKLVLEAGGTLTGAVVDASGGPVASANVRVVVRGNVFWRAQRQAFSGADGKFAIAGLPRRAVDVVAQSEQGSSAIVSADLVATAKQDVALKLDIAGEITGIVVDSAGQPLGDAQVFADPEPTGKPADLSIWVVRGDQEAVTDQAGAFVLSGLPPGGYRVRASRSGASIDEQQLAKFVVAHPGERLRIVVPNEGKITGKVAFADGKVPLAFTVRLGNSYGTPFASADGSFSLAAVAGTHGLVVDGPSFLAAKSREVVVVEGQPTDVGTITVEPGRSISGRVLDERNNPVAGAKIAGGKLLSGGGKELYIPDESIDAKDTTSDGDGRFRLDGFSPGQLNVVAGTASGRSPSIEIPAGTASATVDLVIAPTTSLDGVVTRDGNPLGDTVVIAKPIGATGSNFFVVTGPDGAFALDALAPGAYLVSPMIGGGGSKPKDIYIVRVDLALGTRTHIEVDTTPGPATVTVIAKTDDGQPVAMGGLFLTEATIVVHSAAELVSPDQLDIFGPKPIAVHMRGVIGGSSEVEGVKLGDATLCVTPFAGRPPDDLSKAPIKCQPVHVGPGKQTVTIVVPAPK